MWTEIFSYLMTSMHALVYGRVLTGESQHVGERKTHVHT